jgi:hypothetical protein
MQSEGQEQQAADTAQAHDERAAMLQQLATMGAQIGQMHADMTKVRLLLEEGRNVRDRV